jgi:hypothetical protein
VLEPRAHSLLPAVVRFLVLLQSDLGLFRDGLESNDPRK